MLVRVTPVLLQLMTKITKAAIARMRYRFDPGGKKRDVRWCSNLTGFGVRVLPSGRTSFVVKYKHGGRWRQRTIGNTATMELADAQTLFKSIVGDAAKGIDPATPAGQSVKELCKHYVREAKKHKRTWSEDERRLNKHVVPDKGGWASRAVSSITREDVEKLHARIGKDAEIEANRVLALLSTLLNFATEHGYREGINPAKGVRRYPEHSRERFIDIDDELTALMDALDAEDSVYLRTFFRLAMLTGMRKENLKALRWDQIGDTIRIPRTKAGRIHHIDVTPEIRTVLDSIPRTTSKWVFPGRKKGQHVVNVDKAWRRIRARAGVHDVWVHDFRRSAGSWMAQSGESLERIGRLLDHASPQTTRIYARFAPDHLRKALESHTKRVAKAMGGKRRLRAAK